MNRLCAGISSLQNADGGFPEMGVRPSITQSMWNVIRPSMEHRDVDTLAWCAKKFIRLHFFPQRPIFNNSAKESGASCNESNVFSSWFRFMTYVLARDVISVESSASQMCRLVGLNYFPAQFRLVRSACVN
jgi:hypothetical protein